MGIDYTYIPLKIHLEVNGTAFKLLYNTIVYALFYLPDRFYCFRLSIIANEKEIKIYHRLKAIHVVIFQPN